MSLKNKTLGILLVVVLVYTAVQGIIHQSIIFPGFVALEKDEADKSAMRPAEAIENELFHLSALVSDWAFWDDTYDYTISHSRQYEDVNLNPDSTFTINHINLLYICDSGGQVIWSKVRDPVTGNKVSWIEPGREPFLKNHGFIAANGDVADAERTGIVRTSMGPMMIAVRPILTSAMKGPSRGIFVMGRLLTDDLIQSITRQIGVRFELIPTDSILETDIPHYSDLIRKKRSHSIDGKNLHRLFLYTALFDMDGQPVYLVKGTIPRNILEKAQKTLMYSMLSIIVSCVVLIFPTLFLLQYTILNPLSLLSDHVRRVEESGNLSKRLELDRDDEIGLLGQQFDGMLEKLAEARSDLLERSYYSGLAGMTSDILHNGRNIMMPMSKNMGIMKTMCRTMPRESIRAALEEINAEGGDTERRKNLERFLHLALEELLRSFQEAEQLLEDVSTQAQEMESLFNNLEKHCRSVSLVSPVHPLPILRNALSKIPQHLRKSCPVRIEEGVDSAPMMNADPLILVQVLDTLIHRAMVLSVRGGKDPGVSVDVDLDVRETKTLIRLIIAARGTNEDGEAMKDMFSRTRDSVFESTPCTSLHWCSNVVSAMKGTLDVEITEEGMAFLLLLPPGGGE
jgi:two-component system, NtrC family, sensor kinase